METVIARAYSSKPIKLKVFGRNKQVAFLSTEVAQTAGLPAIGYPLNDIFEFSEENWNQIVEHGDWSKLVQWRGNDENR